MKPFRLCKGAAYGRLRLVGQGIGRLALLIGVALSLGCTDVGRERSATKGPPVELSGLLLSTADLPKRWVLSWGPASVRKHYPMADEALSATFWAAGGPGVAVHTVLQYKDASLAAEEFAAERAGSFRVDEDYQITPWGALAGMNYHSPTAGEFECACATKRRSDGTDQEFTLCVAIARYGQYVSMFSTWLSPTHMSPADLERVLTRIDQRMSMAVLDAPPN